MKTIIWNIFVGILVIIAIIGDIQMVNSLEKTSPDENYVTQSDIDRTIQQSDLMLVPINKN